MENPELKKVFKYTTALIFILSLFLVAKIFGEIKSYRFIGSELPAQNVITVIGSGEVFAIPDIVSFSFTISEEAKTVAEAQAKATKKTNSAIEILKDNGVEEKDIKTTAYNINPKYQYDYNEICPSWGCPPPNQTISGFEVSQTVSVKIRDTEKGGRILTLIGETAPSYVSGLNFEIDDIESVKAEARKLAIEDAKAKAKILSKNLDVKIIGLVSFSEQSGGYYPSYGLGGADFAIAQESKLVSPEIPAGENKIVSDVYLTYEIRN